MTSDSSLPASDSGHADHHDTSNLVNEFRQRQLNLFRERQSDLEPDETISGH
jgi:hypothetical protein